MCFNGTSCCGRLRTESLSIMLDHKVYNSRYNNSHISHAAIHNGQEMKANLVPRIRLVVGVLRRSVFCSRHCSVAVCFFCEGVFPFSVLEKANKQRSHNLGPYVAPSSCRITSSPDLHPLLTNTRHLATPQAQFISPRNSTSSL